MKLFAKYGINDKGVATNFRHLNGFLEIGLDKHRPSIWRLKYMLALGINMPLNDFPEVQDAATEYGFEDQMDRRVRIELWEFYKLLLSRHDPLYVHEARVQGKLMQLSQDLLTQNTADIRELVQNLDKVPIRDTVKVTITPGP